MATGTAITHELGKPEDDGDAGSNLNWKSIAIFLAGLIVSQAVAWATYVRSAVTRAEVSEQIRLEDPYVQDKAAIAVQLQEVSRRIEQQSSDIAAIHDQVARIAIAVGVDPDSRVRSRR